MPFFDFLAESQRYGDKLAKGIHRLNMRHRFIVGPFTQDIAGARVLDIAAHDGRWSYALAAAGAREVVAVEARGELIEQFAEYPDDEASRRVSWIQGDLFEVLRDLASRGERFDVVAVYGIFYHLMDHYLLLKLIHRLGPELVVIDSEFLQVERAVIDVVVEDTSKFLNSTPQIEGQDRAPTGVPSRRAVDVMAGSLGYDVTWSDWNSLPRRDRRQVRAYFRPPEKSRQIRDTCALRPTR